MRSLAKGISKGFLNSWFKVPFFHRSNPSFCCPISSPTPTLLPPLRLHCAHLGNLRSSPHAMILHYSRNISFDMEANAFTISGD